MLVLITLTGCRPGTLPGGGSRGDLRFLTATRAATSPCNGDQKFNVPITRWRSGRNRVEFSLFYHSANNALQFEASKRRIPPGFSGLSEKNSKWVHSFDPWILYFAPRPDGRQEVFLHDVWYHAAYSRVLENNTARYVSQDPDFRPVLTESPQQTGTMVACQGQSQHFRVPESLQLEMPGGTRYVFGHILWQKEGCEAYAQYLLSEYMIRSGQRLTITRRDGDNPQVLTVKDEEGKGLTFNYENGLLVSVTDPDERTHTFSYTAVPDENRQPQQKLTGVKIQGGSGEDHSWSFHYRDDRDPEAHYGGTYTGDLVIYKRDLEGNETRYFYEPVTLVGKPPSVRRPKIGDWDGEVVHIEALIRENGRINKEIYHREENGPNVIMSSPGRPPVVHPCGNSSEQVKRGGS